MFKPPGCIAGVARADTSTCTVATVRHTALTLQELEWLAILMIACYVLEWNGTHFCIASVLYVVCRLYLPLPG